MTNRILAVGAHFDDVELGCGGSLAWHASVGDVVHVFVASNSGFKDPYGKTIRDSKAARRQGLEAADIIGVTHVHEGGFPTNSVPADDQLTSKIRQVIEQHNINWIYTHWHDDAHLDHQVVSRATLSAARHVQRVLLYRSNHFMGPTQPAYNYFIDVSAHIDTKIAALKAYEDEYERAGQMWHETILAENAYWGKRMGVDHIEGFVASRFFHK